MKKKDVHKFIIFQSEMSAHQRKTWNERRGMSHSQKLASHRAMLRPDSTFPSEGFNINFKVLQPKMRKRIVDKILISK